ncbi:MAG: S8 family serine peptidase [Bacteroidota bacterium]
MIRHLLIPIFLIGLLAPLTAQNYDYSKLSQHLIDMIDRGAKDKFPVFIELSDQVDVLALDAEFYNRRASNQERTRIVIDALQTKAAATQPSVLQIIQRLDGIDQASVESFWISNVITLETELSALAALSYMPEIQWIGYQGNVEPDAFIDEGPAPMVSPNGTEPGLRAIKAPEMWKLGYTGYGRKGLVIDSGVDPTHPALHNQWWGNHVEEDQAWNDAGNRIPQDCGDHGSHVCGTMMGLDRMNNDTIGVAFNGNWMAAAIFSGGCGGGFNFVINSFQWAINPDGNSSTTDDMPDVINNSWRWDEGNQCGGTFKQTFDAVEAAGIAIVFSAGNDGPDDMSITSPKNINTSLVNTFATGNLNGNNSNLIINNGSSRGPSICGGDSSLLIKPEVSAPGTSVRSSVPGGYDNFTGTSMAAPHAAGSVMLLKEAFPFLTGAEVKLALYFSARDLGAPGEDNFYGMGIIDVPAAYQYLIDQGHTPASPLVTNDVLLVDLSTTRERDWAELGTVPRLIVENSGAVELTSFDVFYQVSAPAGVSGSWTWEGNLAVGERVEVEIPLGAIPAGNYELTINLVNPNGQTDERPLNNLLRTNIELIDAPAIATAVSVDANEICMDASVMLQADAGNGSSILWYDANEGGNLLGEGATYVTEPLTGPTTFYADANFIENVGMTTVDTTNAILANTVEAGIVFDCHEEAVLKTVTIYVEETGSRLITLRDAEGITWAQKIVSISEIGENVVELNFNIPVGNQLVLGLDFGKELYFSTSGVNFPYEIENIVTLRSSNVIAGSLTRYYYFYNWEVEYKHPCGRTPVSVEPANSDPSPDAAFDVTTDQNSWLDGVDIAFSNTSTDASSYLWDFGDGATSTDENPSHIFAEPGTYNVSLVVKNSAGCSDAFATTLEIGESPVSTADLTGAFAGISVYPNPAQSHVFVDFDLEEAQQVTITLYDILGKEVIRIDEQNRSREQLRIDLPEAASGLYYLQFKIGNQSISKKLLIAR